MVTPLAGATTVTVKAWVKFDTAPFLSVTVALAVPLTTPGAMPLMVAVPSPPAVSSIAGSESVKSWLESVTSGRLRDAVGLKGNDGGRGGLAGDEGDCVHGVGSGEADG